MTITLEQALACLREEATGPKSAFWYYSPHVNALLAHIDAQAADIEKLTEQRQNRAREADSLAHKCRELEKERDAATLEYDYLNDQIKFHSEKVKGLYKELAAVREQKPAMCIAPVSGEKGIWREVGMGYHRGRQVWFSPTGVRGALSQTDELPDLEVSTLNKILSGEIKSGSVAANLVRHLLQRSAPVAVPDEMKLKDAVNFIDDMSPPSEAEAAMFAFNACRAEVLRLNSGSKPDDR